MASKKMIAVFLILGLVAVTTGCSDTNTNPVAVAPDTAPPALPSNLDVAFSDGVATISWDLNVTDADLAGYIVTRERNGVAETLLATPTMETNYTDSAPLAGSSSYHVYAVDTTGNESAVVTTYLLVALSHGNDTGVAD